MEKEIAQEIKKQFSELGLIKGNSDIRRLERVSKGSSEEDIKEEIAIYDMNKIIVSYYVKDGKAYVEYWPDNIFCPDRLCFPNAKVMHVIQNVLNNYGMPTGRITAIKEKLTGARLD
ncbi:MAG: hypothetical protein QXW10_03270 [Candidatus Micrarchaeaceae archaeon]